MFKKLLEFILNAIKGMTAYKDVNSTLDTTNLYTIPTEMQDAIDVWTNMYKDKSPWLDNSKGIYSLGLPKLICQSIQRQMLSEMETDITDPHAIPVGDEEIEIIKNTRASFLNDIYKNHLINKLPDNLEKALATGGMIIKPYISNDSIYFDINFQGEFLPLQFNDDGDITDIAFTDQFVSGKNLFTRIERQTFNQDNHTVVIQNKAFKTEIIDGNSDNVQQDLGKEVPLTVIDKWANISPEVTIQNVDSPLYGYYKVPLGNNIDMNCPLGISIFSPAVKLIRKADEQFSRLDWEYEGGQLAIDVDTTALPVPDTYYGTTKMDNTRDRLYRKLDLGTETTYNAFAPSLRDANYIQGLNTYTNKIEDIIGLSRGALSQVDTEARTATEIKILKQRTYITITDNQQALEKCIRSVIKASDIFATLYNLSVDGVYNLNIEWKDNVLTDTNTELQERLLLCNNNILSAAEVRAWYTGETEEEAQEKLDIMQKHKMENMMNDVFTQQNESTLEKNEDPEEE